MANLDSILKSRDINLPTKVCNSQSYGFFSSHLWMWELNYKESRALKNWYFWTMVLDKTLESPLDCKEIKPNNPKGNQSWIRRADAEAEITILLATWCEELTHRKRPWCWERLKAGGEGDRRRWNGWMASPTRWTWVWASFGSCWWTGKPGILQAMGSQSRTWLSDWNELILIHFSLLTPKILMFTLAISCLTTSNLLWFMHLIFQVPMQYCSL